jgi:hypothetical protein
MSEKEHTFIRQLKITLIVILGPFTLGTIASAVTDHFQIKNNREHIELMEQMQRQYVTNETLLIYYNQLRELNKTLKEDMQKSNAETEKKLEKVNDEMDDIMKSVFQAKRGATPNNRIDEN